MRSSTLALTAWIATALAQSPSLSEVLASQPDLSTLAEALSIVPDLAAAVSNLTDITILAPTNTAFEALLAQGPNQENTAIKNRDQDGISALISYHVINGTFKSSDFTEIPTYVNTLFTQTNVTDGQNVGLVLDGKDANILSGQLQNCKVVEADIQVIPGITIHKIDEVLVTPLSLSDTLTRLPQIKVNAALGALGATNLVETVDTIEDITIFIPNDQAFVEAQSALQNATVDDLTSVLKYHVIQGAVAFASDVTNTTIKTVNGNEITLSVGFDGTVYVDNAKVVLPNIVISNGVAHIISGILNPEQADINRDELGASTTLASISNTMVPFTESAMTPSTTISIPALATTAQFAAPGGANATATTPAPSGSMQPAPMQSDGAAGKIGSALGGAAMGLGMALLF